MKYRIRYYLCLVALPITAVLCLNAGHTMGLKDMHASYEMAHGGKLQQIEDIRYTLCQLPVGGAACEETDLTYGVAVKEKVD